MIRTIEIHDEATYATHTVLDNLAEVNFFFGGNGTGKTTLSRVVTTPDRFPKCETTWHDVAMNVVTYNQDFVDNHFRDDCELPGIFTLGAEESTRRTQIREKTTLADKLRNEISGLTVSLCGDDGSGGKRDEKRQLEQALRENCWRIKRRYRTQFEPAFAGLGTKEKLKERVLEEARAVGGKPLTIEELTDRARTVFATSPSQADSLVKIVDSTLITTETDPILAKAIVGAKDVDISALITQLQNSDWVSKGRHYAAQSKGKCPFCQQSIPDGLLQELEEFFDRTYVDQIQEVDRLYSAYRSDAERILTSLQQIADSSSIQFLEESNFNQLRSTLSGLVQANIAQLNKKQEEPSCGVTLSNTSDMIEQLNALIQIANDRIKAHNELIVNLSRESRKLTKDFWQFIVAEELREVIEQHDKAANNLEKAIEGISQRKQQKEEELTKCEAEMRKLESEITSIQPTASAINETLAAFGFDSFKLACADGIGTYKLVRSNGQDASATLSPGEKTFISFLYFYHLLQGSNNCAGTTDDRIVVIDDPVCSVDSYVMIVVSALIRKLISEVRQKAAFTKQLDRSVDQQCRPAFPSREHDRFSHRGTEAQRTCSIKSGLGPSVCRPLVG